MPRSGATRPRSWHGGDLAEQRQQRRQRVVGGEPVARLASEVDQLLERHARLGEGSLGGGARTAASPSACRALRGGAPRPRIDRSARTAAAAAAPARALAARPRCALGASSLRATSSNVGPMPASRATARRLDERLVLEVRIDRGEVEQHVGEEPARLGRRARPGLASRPASRRVCGPCPVPPATTAPATAADVDHELAGVARPRRRCASSPRPSTSPDQPPRQRLEPLAIEDVEPLDVERRREQRLGGQPRRRPPRAARERPRPQHRLRVGVARRRRGPGARPRPAGGTPADRPRSGPVATLTRLEIATSRLPHAASEPRSANSSVARSNRRAVSRYTGGVEASSGSATRKRSAVRTRSPSTDHSTWCASSCPKHATSSSSSSSARRLPLSASTTSCGRYASAAFARSGPRAGRSTIGRLSPRASAARRAAAWTRGCAPASIR